MTIAPDEKTVLQLIDDQLPELRHLPVRAVASEGAINAIFRIGDDLVARFRLHDTDPDETRQKLEHQYALLDELASISPFPTPQPVAIAEPGHGYPLPWSVQTWLPGTTASVDDPSTSVPFALDLAAFITALRSADTRGRTFQGDYRGGHLSDHDDWLETCFRHSEGLLDVPRLRAMWSGYRELPEVDADVLCHGDLIPPNVLVRDGRLAGVLDADEFGPADPALDLVAAWHLLDDEPRQALRDALLCSDVQWARGQAWAFEQAMGLPWYYTDKNPTLAALGQRTLERLTAASASGHTGLDQ